MFSLLIHFPLARINDFFFPFFHIYVGFLFVFFLDFIVHLLRRVITSFLYNDWFFVVLLRPLLVELVNWPAQPISN